MSRDELENLVAVGSLKRGGSSPREIAGLIASGRARLHDASNAALSPDSRFDLAYNAAHALALAALRHAGYRSDNRYVVFQALPHTLALGPRVWRVLSRAHAFATCWKDQGAVEVDPRLIDDLLAAAAQVEQAVARIE